MKKTKNTKSKKSSLITPLRLSLAVNLLLLMVLLMGISVLFVLRDEFNRGSVEMARWTFLKNFEMCENIEAKSQKWLKNQNLSPDYKQFVQLNLKATCRDSSYLPYEEKALMEYFKANGFDYQNPPAN